VYSSAGVEGWYQYSADKHGSLQGHQFDDGLSSHDDDGHVEQDFKGTGGPSHQEPAICFGEYVTDEVGEYHYSPQETAEAVWKYERFYSLPSGCASLPQFVHSAGGVSGWLRHPEDVQASVEDKAADACDTSTDQYAHRHEPFGLAGGDNMHQVELYAPRWMSRKVFNQQKRRGRASIPTGFRPKHHRPRCSKPFCADDTTGYRQCCSKPLHPEDVRAECNLLCTEAYVKSITFVCGEKERNILSAADKEQRRRWFANASQLIARRKECGVILGGMHAGTVQRHPVMPTRGWGHQQALPVREAMT